MKLYGYIRGFQSCLLKVELAIARPDNGISSKPQISSKYSPKCDIIGETKTNFVLGWTKFHTGTYGARFYTVWAPIYTYISWSNSKVICVDPQSKVLFGQPSTRFSQTKYLFERACDPIRNILGWVHLVWTQILSISVSSQIKYLLEQAKSYLFLLVAKSNIFLSKQNPIYFCL